MKKIATLIGVATLSLSVFFSTGIATETTDPEIGDTQSLNSVSLALSSDPEIGDTQSLSSDPEIGDTQSLSSDPEIGDTQSLNPVVSAVQSSDPEIGDTQ